MCANVYNLLRRHEHHNKMQMFSSLSSQTLRQLVSSLPLLMLVAILMDAPCACHAGIGYSYTRFIGPVSGPERNVLPHHGIDTADYVAHPLYQFSYGVEDSEQRLLQNRKETRDGDQVRGVYSLVDPDGALRVVKYMADDEHGFQAEVIKNGVSALHGNADPHYESQANWQTENESSAPREYYEVNENEHEPSQIESDEEDAEDTDDHEENYEIEEPEQTEELDEHEYEEHEDIY